MKCLKELTIDFLIKNLTNNSKLITKNNHVFYFGTLYTSKYGCDSDKKVLLSESGSIYDIYDDAIEDIINDVITIAEWNSFKKKYINTYSLKDERIELLKSMDLKLGDIVSLTTNSINHIGYVGINNKHPKSLIVSSSVKLDESFSNFTGFAESLDDFKKKFVSKHS